MNFKEYQELTATTAIYPEGFIYPTLGLSGETGEVAEFIKKTLRDHDGIISEERKAMLKKELGDVLWYISELSRQTGLSLQEIAEENIAKLASRKERGVLHGSGDNR